MPIFLPRKDGDSSDASPPILTGGLSLYRCMICLALASLALLAVLSCSGTEDITPQAAVSPMPSSDLPSSQVREEITFNTLPFEEAHGAPLEESIKKVDYALLLSLDQTTLSHDRMELLRVDMMEDEDGSYHHQTIQLTLEGPAGRYLYELRQMLSRLCPDAFLRPMADTEQENTAGIGASPASYSPDASQDISGQALWEIVTMGRPTHVLAINVPPDFHDDPNAMDWRLPDGVALLTIVIDDMGESQAMARGLADLDYPVVFSILPYTTHVREVAEMAHDHNLEVLLHQPMEPMDAHTNPGPTALYDTMDARSVRETFAANMDTVPYAIGVNNHMGSRFTQNKELLKPVVDEAFRRDWLILDSLTHPRSELADLAWEQGLPALRRDVFLDVVKDVDSIYFQLKKAERIALKQGRAIAIGHPYQETLDALRRFQSSRDTRIQIVSISSQAPGASPWLVDSSPVDSTAISR